MKSTHPSPGEFKPANITHLVSRLTMPPKDPDLAFIYKGPSVDVLYSMALSLRAWLLLATDAKRPICLCTEDRTLTAAALMASLMGAPPVILPNNDSLQTLNEVHRVLDFGVILSDRDRPVPEDVTLLRADIDAPTPSNAPPIIPRPLDHTWVYLFTGGSTGKPQFWSKTVINLLGEAADQAANFGLTGQDIILATVPPNHIYGLLYSVLMPLIAKARVVAQSPTYPQEMRGGLRETKATLLVSIPLHFRALKGNSIKNHALRLAFSSAGPLAEADGRSFFKNSGVAIQEIYGSTETGGIARRCRATGQNALTPFDSVTLKIVDEQLWVRSAYLSPELKTDGQGYFKTADRAETDTAGGFSLLGRVDGITKIGGQRVDLTNIQETLKKAPRVTDAFVFSQRIQGGREPVIHAVIQGRIDADQLRAFCQVQLEPHSHPKRIRIIETLPRTSAGKYDRQAMQDLFGIYPEGGGTLFESTVTL